MIRLKSIYTITDFYDEYPDEIFTTRTILNLSIWRRDKSSKIKSNYVTKETALYEIELGEDVLHGHSISFKTLEDCCKKVLAIIKERKLTSELIHQVMQLTIYANGGYS